MLSDTYRIWNPDEYDYGHAFGFLPKLTSYLHEDSKKRGCVLVVPGGGYCSVSPTEGELVALNFYEKGYQAFVLTYTVNPLQMEPLRLQPLKDISRAMRYIRKFSDCFYVDSNCIIVCGFSAGGHLCGSLCVHYDDIKEESEEFEGISNRPDAAVLCYPVITSGKYIHEDSFVSLFGLDASEEELEYLSLEKQVKRHTPPVFLWTTAEDELVPPENSILFADACRKNGVRCAFHMFSSGRHGLSLADEDWANGVHQNPYTLEQLACINTKIESGELVVPKEARAGFQARYTQFDIQNENPNEEVMVWQKLADIFLKEVFYM